MKALAPWLIILLSFGIVAVFYEILPHEILIARGIFDGENVTAPKSIFTAFRPQLIDLICAMAIEVMRRNAVERALPDEHGSFWTTLLFVAAFKSLFQALETVAGPNYSSFWFYVTAFVVIVGILGALIQSRRIFTSFRLEHWVVERRRQVLLLVLLGAYIGISLVPIFLYN